MKSAFPVPEWALAGGRKTLAVGPEVAESYSRHLRALKQLALGGLMIEWARDGRTDALAGTVAIAGGRQQPFTLLLRWDQGSPLLRCISPIGRTEADDDPRTIVGLTARSGVRVGAILTDAKRTYDLTMEDDVLLVSEHHDAARAGLLVRRVTAEADRLEREFFDGTRDAPLSEFAADLDKEGHHDG